MYKTHSYRRFNAFLRFSIPELVEAADRLTALVVVAAAGPATLEFAVPSGNKRSLLSLLDTVLVESAEGNVFAGDVWRGCDGGAGEDLRGDDADVGTGSVICGSGTTAGVGMETGIDVVGDSSSFSVDGVWNSGGRVRGVACTLVISFAREQYAS
jgi:hypothetical protein